MIEHHQPHLEHEHHIKFGYTFKPALTIALSILVGAFIVAGSIFFTFKGSDSETIYGQGNLQVPSAPTAPVAQGGTPKNVEVSNRDNQPTLGNKNAKITIYEFSDFQCPFCKQYVDSTHQQIVKEYVDTGKAKIVFKHFPLSFHANAENSAIAAECANLQGKFWQYHDRLFLEAKSDGAGLDIDNLKKYGNELGLNNGNFGFGKNKFNSCLDSKDTLKIVQGDNADGVSYSISGTPSFVIVKDSDKTIDVNAVNQAMQSRQNVISLENGNLVLVGAQPFSTFKTQLDAMVGK